MGFGLIIQRRFQIPLRGWPECSGMGGRNKSESVAGMRRNTHQRVGYLLFHIKARIQRPAFHFWRARENKKSCRLLPKE